MREIQTDREWGKNMNGQKDSFSIHLVLIMKFRRHFSRCGLFVGVVAIAGLLPDFLCAESGFVEQFKFSGGIVVALDFDEGQSIADLATDGPFVVHALLRDEARVAAARRVIQEAGVYGKVSCELYNVATCLMWVVW